MKYRQLTQDERYMNGQLRRQGLGLSEMARLMSRQRSTIWRELNQAQHDPDAARPGLLRKQGGNHQKNCNGAQTLDVAAEAQRNEAQSRSVAIRVESGCVI